MDFALNTEQQELQKTLRAFCKENIAPNAVKVDESGKFPRDNWAALASQGFFGLMLPEAAGGRGMDLIAGVVAAAELAASCGATAMAATTSAWLCNTAILKYGSEDLKNKLLPALAKGEKIGAFAMAEPGAGTDFASIAATAVRDGDNYILNGVKGLVWNGPVADVMIVFAKEGDEIVAFAVESGAAGLAAGAAADTLGFRGAEASSMELKDCAVPAANKLAGGWDMIADLLDYARLQIAAVSVGLSQACYDEARVYSEDRVAFGKPIGVFQEVAFRVADLFMDTDMSLQLTCQAAWMKQNGMKCAPMIACAKLFASEALVRNAGRAVHILGGRGYVKGCVSERVYRDAKFTEIGAGSSEIMRQIIAEDLLGEF